MFSLSRQTFFTAAAVALMLVAMHSTGFAQAGTAGQNLVGTFRDAIENNIGLFIGLGITLLGLWTWIIKQETGAGVTMIIGGVLFTLVPDIFTGMRGVVDGVVGQFSGSANAEGIIAR